MRHSYPTLEAETAHPRRGRNCDCRARSRLPGMGSRGWLATASPSRCSFCVKSLNVGAPRAAPKSLPHRVWRGCVVSSTCRPTIAAARDEVAASELVTCRHYLVNHSNSVDGTALEQYCGRGYRPRFSRGRGLPTRVLNLAQSNASA